MKPTAASTAFLQTALMHLLPTASHRLYRYAALLADDHITSENAPLAGICQCMISSGRWRTAQRCRCIMRTVQIRCRPVGQAEIAQADPGCHIKLPTLIFTWEEKLERKFAKEIMYSHHQMNSCVHCKDFVGHYSDLCGPAAERCSPSLPE